MSDWGIKVCNAGTSVASTDIRDQIMNSQYSMFKYHSDGTVAGTIAQGGTVAYGTIAHNLGYVPAFLAYVNYPGDSYQRIVPSIPYGVSFDWYADASAGTANIIVAFRLVTPYNQTSQLTTDYFNSSSGRGNVYTGNVGGVGAVNGAMRFTNVDLDNSESITSAVLNYKVYAKGTSTSDILMKTYGIDEDNVSDFGSDPMGKAETTAVTTQSQAPSGTPFDFGINVKSQVDEIVARPGWSNGNAMAFKVKDNSSPTDAYVADGYGAGVDVSYLTITRPGTVVVGFRVIVFKDKIV